MNPHQAPIRRLIANSSLILAALVMSGCGSSDDSDGSASDSSTSIAETTSTTYRVPEPFPTNLPEKVRSRPPLPDCGEYDSLAYGAQGFGKLPAAEQLKLDCFWRAHDSHASAELRAITTVSIEGAVRPVIFRTFADRKPEQIFIHPDGTAEFATCNELIHGNALVPTCL
jgi:hypothetical protein